MPAKKRSIPHLIAAGLILSVVPALTLARQSSALPNRVELTLPTTLQLSKGTVQAKTEINTLDLNQLAGNNDMSVGDVVYVHLNIGSSAADEGRFHLNYPFAISQNRPAKGDESTITLRGVVTVKEGDTVNISYLFETLPANKTLVKALSSATTKAEITIDVNRRAVGHAQAVTINGKRYAIKTNGL